MSANTGNTEQGGASSAGTASEDVRQAFSKLPFDQQVSTLFRIEIDMLGEAAEAVVSAASRVADEIVDACSERPAQPAPDDQASAS